MQRRSDRHDDHQPESDHASTDACATATAEPVERHCPVCRRTINGKRSLAKGIGRTCWRKIRRARSEDPLAACIRYVPDPGDIILIRDRLGNTYGNIVGPLDWQRPDDSGPMKTVMRAMAYEILRLHGVPLAAVSRAVAERFAAEFLATLPPDGGTINGSDINMFALLNCFGVKARRGPRVPG